MIHADNAEINRHLSWGGGAIGIFMGGESRRAEAYETNQSIRGQILQVPEAQCVVYIYIHIYVDQRIRPLPARACIPDHTATKEANGAIKSSQTYMSCRDMSYGGHLTRDRVLRLLDDASAPIKPTRSILP